MTKQKFLKGDLIEILPQFQDEGDSEYIWEVLNDEEKGRVSISALNSEMLIKPIHVVERDWIRHKSRSIDLGNESAPDKRLGLKR
jgi:hypothetical protein